nr:DUF6543 domain-containing protein [uncultured Pseudomonas sp.]
MNKEVPNEWFTPDLQDRPHGPHEAGQYPAPPEPEREVGTWRPELLQEFIEHQNVGYESPRQYAYRQAADYVRADWPPEPYSGPGAGFGHYAFLRDSDPDNLLIVTLYINAQDQEPQRANVAYSMTLTHALMRNWQQNGNGQFLDHLSHLRAYREGGYPARIAETPLVLADCFPYEAIYRKTSPQRFDRSTHVSIDPIDFKQFVWDADLQTHYLESLNTYWKNHGADYNLLIKAALLKSAYVQHQERSLSTQDKASVLEALGLAPDQPWETLTLERFTHAAPSSDFTYRELVLYRYVATDIIVIRNELTDGLVVYIPGNSSPLHGFQDLAALCDWIVAQCKDPHRRRALESHFKAEDDPDGYFLSGVQTALAGLAAYPDRLNDATGHWWPHKEITLSSAISQWPFSHFKHNLQDRLASDGRQLIRNRADYNKEQAAQMLTNAIIATGAVAMAVPALWVPLSVMSLALIGMGVDEVVEGKTHEERQEGAGRIVFGVLNALPLAIEGGIAAHGFWSAAASVEDGIAAGGADEVGQMVEGRGADERDAAMARQQEENADITEEAQERERESANDRQALLDREEQQRQAAQSHREATYDSAKAFGVEPEGLRSLTPELRAELAKFEYRTPLDRSGAWGVDDFGAVYTVGDIQTGKVNYFARVHSKIYRVERVSGARQYRIFSPDDSNIKGPFIKGSRGYYSDVDLKPGLRGGESYIEIAPAPVPETGKPDIVLAPGQDAPTTIEIPMDGIEVRPGVNDDYQPADQYFLRYKGKEINVRYDADHGCWQEHYDFYWRNNKGVWRKGAEEDFLKARNKLNFGITSDLYKFPLLPGYPAEPEAIELKVHQIWLGDRLPRTELIETMKANMKLSPSVQFTLHIDIDNNEVLEELLPKARLQAEFAEFPNLTVSNLDDEPFFEDFIAQDQTARPFHYFRSGEGQNLAAASDVLRYRLINEYGGIYMDCDDVMKNTFDGAHIKAGRSDVLMGKLVTFEKAGFAGPNNSHFASLPGNPVLREVQEELYSRFNLEREALDQLKGAKTIPATGKNPYVVKIFEVTGPRFFLDTLKKLRPDIGSILDGSLKPKWGIRSSTYREFVDDLTDFYAPFRHRLTIEAGGENSWVAPDT